MREAVQRIYRERKALVASLKVRLTRSFQPIISHFNSLLQDVGSIVAKLDGVLLCVALMLAIFIGLLIFQRGVSSLVPLATVVLGFSFIFGNSAQTLFESVSSFVVTVAWSDRASSIAHLHLLHSRFRHRRPCYH